MKTYIFLSLVITATGCHSKSKSLSTTNEAALVDGQYIDKSTFEGKNSWSGRDSIEVESVMTITNISTEQTIDLIYNERDGRTHFQRMRRPTHAEAFALGYHGFGNIDKAVEEMDWSSRAHENRESLPWVALTIENGRLEPDVDDFRYEASLGTDYMADTYYDTQDSILLDNDMLLRGRVRMDQPGSIRRILIQSKIGLGVDQNGSKKAQKRDVRMDGATWDDVSQMPQSIQSGITAFGFFTGNTLFPIRTIYDNLADQSLLPTIDGNENVLALVPKVNLMAIRSRYHLNRVDNNNLMQLFQNGKKQIGELRHLVYISSLSGNERQALIDQGEDLADLTSVALRARTQIQSIDPSANVDRSYVARKMETLTTRRSLQSINTEEFQRDVEILKVIAVALSDLYHEYADNVRDARRAIAGATSGDVRDAADEFVIWARQTDSLLAVKGAMLPFVKKYNSILNSADSSQAIADFAQFLESRGEDFMTSAMSAAEQRQQFLTLGSGVMSKHVNVLGRMLEAAGTSAKTLWARRAGERYTGEVWSSNFLIDTFDATVGVRSSDWQAMTEQQQRGFEPIPRDKIIFASIVNEVQIELGSERQFTSNIDRFKQEILADQAKYAANHIVELKANDQGFTPENQAFLQFIEELLTKPADEINSFLIAVNQKIQNKGSYLPPLSSDDLQAMTKEENRAEVTAGDEVVDSYNLVDLQRMEGLFNNMKDAQQWFASQRSRRVLREVERAGIQNAGWGNASASKGKQALTNAR